ncbi:metallophosphoesterase [Streptococcus suis]|uniref:Metallophosphoesterase n=1 Tax=Streptococcus suis TaxID=1307 RepID=A0A9X4MSE6_STRSU|nr:metallophosphoesterase [Streptococcus suis]MDG4527407.1 metallophosphoesterase [Streptococcus suis]MDG4529696.1 metallophosphoesterase [Streptococcus suis]
MKKLKNIKPRWFVFICILIFLALGFDSRLQVTYYRLVSPKISQPIRLALITDLHSSNYGKNQIQILETLEKEEPDIILLGGDIFDDELSDRKTLELLSGLGKFNHTYYVSGNHEIWSNRYDQMLEHLRQQNVVVLSGNSSRVDVRGQSITISGIDDPEYFQKYDTSESLLDQLEDIKGKQISTDFQVLLAHRPELIDTYQKYGFDLALSGHAHGGQWRVPYLVNGVFAPNQGFLPKYAGGLYEVENSHFIVSRGLAKESTRVPRFFNRPEIIIVDLVNQ